MPNTYSIAIGSDHAGFKYKEAIIAGRSDRVRPWFVDF